MPRFGLLQEPSDTKASTLLNLEIRPRNIRFFHIAVLDDKITDALVILRKAAETSDKLHQAEQLKTYIDSLQLATQQNVPMASYFLDRLVEAIIRSNANLNTKKINALVGEINDCHFAYSRLYVLIDQEPTRSYMECAKNIVDDAWEIYTFKNKKNPLMLEVIKQTQITAINPTTENIDKYKSLIKRVERNNWDVATAGMIVGVTLGTAGATTAAVVLPIGLIFGFLAALSTGAILAIIFGGLVCAAVGLTIATFVGGNPDTPQSRRDTESLVKDMGKFSELQPSLSKNIGPEQPNNILLDHGLACSEGPSL